MARESLDYVYSVGELVGEFWLWLHCPCGHSVKRDPADIAEQVGLDLPMKVLARRARCERCGHHGCSLHLQPPYLGDADRPRQLQHAHRDLAT